MNYGNINDQAKQIQVDWDVSDFEALQIAVKMQQNNLFAQAHVLNTPSPAPSALEAIAIALGYRYKTSQTSVADQLGNIAEQIRVFSEEFEKKDFL